MKVNFVRNEILLSEVSSEDIMFCNIAGRDTGSIYYNPKNPEHSIRIMFKDQAVIDSLNERGVPLVLEQLDDAAQSQANAGSHKKHHKEEEDRNNYRILPGIAVPVDSAGNALFIFHVFSFLPLGTVCPPLGNQSRKSIAFVS